MIFNGVPQYDRNGLELINGVWVPQHTVDEVDVISGIRQSSQNGIEILNGVPQSVSVEDSIPAVFTFQTTGQIFRGHIRSVDGAPTISWQIQGQAEITTADTGEIDFGSRATRTHTLTVTPWTGVLDLDLDRSSGIDQIYTGTMDFRMMTAMTDLDVDGESAALPGTVTTIKLNGLTVLADFDMEEQAITSAGLQGLDECSGLITFDINKNNLTSMPSFHASAPPNITRLVLQGNPITSIDLTGFDASLTTLRFGGSSQPTSMPDVSSLSGLDFLQVQDSGIETIALDEADHSLSSLLIHDNASLQNFSIANVSNLQLDGQNNDIKQADIDSLIQSAAGFGLTSNWNLKNNNLMSAGRYSDFFTALNESNTERFFCDLPTENFSGYTEVDPNSRLSLSSGIITASGLTKDEAAYFYEDKGAGAIADSVAATFKINVSAEASGLIAPFALTSTLGDISTIVAADTWALFFYLVGDGAGNITPWMAYRGTGGALTNTGTALSLNTDYWVYFTKRDTRSTNGWAEFQIHDNANFSNTVSVSNIGFDAAARVNHRYVMSALSWDTNEAAKTISATIEDFEILVE